MTLKNANQEIADLVRQARNLLQKAEDIADDHDLYFAFAETFTSRVARGDVVLDEPVSPGEPEFASSDESSWRSSDCGDWQDSGC